MKTKIEKIEIGDIILEGYVFEKTIKNFSFSSGAIFVPRKFVGQKFKVILIPLDKINIKISK